MGLFRREAIDQQSDRLEGDVFVGLPVSWQIIGYALGASVIAAITFLALATYPRLETARGVLRPDLGVASILPPGTGTVTELHVTNGDVVRPGQVMVTAEAEGFLASGQGASSEIIASLRRQMESLDAQIAAARDEGEAEGRRIDTQIAGLEGEIALIENQIDLQEGRIATAEADVEAIRPAVDRGVIVRRDLVEREEALAERRQQLSQLQQSRAGRISAREEALRSRDQLAARTEEREAQLAAQRQGLSQSIAANERLRAYVLQAPVAGMVSNLSARVGSTLSPDRPVAAIIPAGSKLEAELLVPSDAIGFVAEGQEVRVAIDTFPYERFGVLPGTVLEVARTADQAADGTLTYPVRVELARDYMDAFGARQPLVSGMTLTARIVIGRRSLVEWLFEPFYALARR